MENFTAESTIHGINYIFGEGRHKFVRISWILLLLTSICGFSIYFYNSFTKWQFTPDIAMKQEERSTREFPMPAITFCPRFFSKNNLANYSSIFQPTANITSKAECEYTAANMNWCEPLLMDKVKEVCEEFINDIENIDVLDLIDKSAPKRHELLNRDFFFLRIFTNRGVCYTMNIQDFSTIFNEAEIHESFHRFKNEKNPEFEWTVERGYFTENASYPARFVSRGEFHIQLKLNQKDGDNSCGSMYIFVHLPSEIPTAFHKFSILGYGSRSTVFIRAISQRTSNALRNYSPEVRKCFFDGEKKLKFFKSYSMAHCQLECLAEATLRKCGCTQFWMPRSKTTRVCRYSEMNCVNSLSTEQHKQSSFCGCLPACNDIKYEVDIYPARNRKFVSLR